jgi:ubiquinone/menaquinone biosynthesis C-methylase UbiE
MSSDDQYTRWTDVDRMPDARSVVTFLDRATAQESVHAYKAESFALLAPKTGAALLEVGCGTGTDVRALATMVAPGGRVVGVDRSETLLTEARRQTDVAGATIEFRQGDAHGLEFPDGVFDGCRADRVFQHLAEPAQALAELVRVARRGAPIVISEPDWETVVIDAPDRGLFRRLVAHDVDRHQNGWMGRQLPRLFRDVGLTGVAIKPHAVFITDYEVVKEGAALEERARAAGAAKVISPAEEQRWLEHVASLRDRGQFWFAMMVFTVRGIKP